MRLQYVGFYISNKIDYRRCDNLEGIDSNLIIIDILGSSTTRIINVYRSFNPQNGISQREKFKYQLSIIKEAFTKGTIILGDFNLDYFKKHSVNYTSSRMFEDFEEKLSDLDLIQLVRCNTWSRIVNNIFRESLLDHIYVNDPTICSDVTTLKPCFGDHKLVMIELLIINFLLSHL